MTNTFEHLKGEWISAYEVEVLNYNSNFGNWLDASGTPGYFLLDIAEDTIAKQKTAVVWIPTKSHYGPEKGYFKIFVGEIKYSDKGWQIKQYMKDPVFMDQTKEGSLIVELYGRKIEFRKRETLPDFSIKK